MKTRGFTVVEIIITVTVMGILLLLAVVNVNSSQANARDDQRKADTQSIAIALESYYLIRPNAASATSRYPSTNQITSESAILSIMPDVVISSFIAPGATTVAESFIPATNTNQTVGGVLPQPTTSQYVYQPLNATGGLCNLTATVCRKFNIFYRLETDSVVYRLESRNR